MPRLRYQKYGKVKNGTPYYSTIDFTTALFKDLHSHWIGPDVHYECIYI